MLLPATGEEVDHHEYADESGDRRGWGWQWLWLLLPSVLCGCFAFFKKREEVEVPQMNSSSWRRKIDYVL